MKRDMVVYKRELELVLSNLEEIVKDNNFNSRGILKDIIKLLKDIKDFNFKEEILKWQIEALYDTIKDYKEEEEEGAILFVKSITGNWLHEYYLISDLISEVL